MRSIRRPSPSTLLPFASRRELRRGRLPARHLGQQHGRRCAKRHGLPQPQRHQPRLRPRHRHGPRDAVGSTPSRGAGSSSAQTRAVAPASSAPSDPTLAFSWASREARGDASEPKACRAGSSTACSPHDPVRRRERVDSRRVDEAGHSKRGAERRGDGDFRRPGAPDSSPPRELLLEVLRGEHVRLERRRHLHHQLPELRILDRREQRRLNGFDHSLVEGRLVL